jgi:hypothetical protein
MRRDLQPAADPPKQERPGSTLCRIGLPLSPWGLWWVVVLEYRDFYFHALGSLVILSFPQLLSFFSVLFKPLSETVTSAETAGCPMGQHLWPLTADWWGHVEPAKTRQSIHLCLTVSIAVSLTKTRTSGASVYRMTSRAMTLIQGAIHG